jgi:protease I
MEFGLSGKRIAILATDGVEQIELTEPRRALDEAGAVTHLVSIKPGEIQAFNHFDKADRFAVDRTVDAASAADYDALLLPGGVANSDTLRANKQAVSFVRAFVEADKPVAAICHGPWLLVEADVLAGRTITSWPSLKTDVENAGGEWVDKPVQVDQKLVTSRKPDDLPAFTRTILREFSNRMDEAKVDSLVAQTFPASDPLPGPVALGRGDGEAAS